MEACSNERHPFIISDPGLLSALFPLRRIGKLGHSIARGVGEAYSGSLVLPSAITNYRRNGATLTAWPTSGGTDEPGVSPQFIARAIAGGSTDITLVETAVSGMTIGPLNNTYLPQYVTEWSKLNMKPQVTILHIGENDIQDASEVAGFATSLETVCDTLDRWNPEGRILLMGIHTSLTPQYQEYLAGRAAQIVTAANRSTRSYVDLSGNEITTTDSVHFDLNGYAIAADYAYDALLVGG